MLRLFTGISVPEALRTPFWLISSGLPGARWTEPEDFHLTLRFLGELEGHVAHEVDERLQEIDFTPFHLMLSGLGVSPSRGEPKTLWAGVLPSPELMQLQHHIETMCRDLSLEPEERKFSPHVTLARLNQTPVDRLVRYLGEHAQFSVPSFEVSEFHLYSSHRPNTGSRYQIENTYAAPVDLSPLEQRLRKLRRRSSEKPDP